jgi:hypothetical protein
MRIDGSTSSSKQIGQTFTYSGSGYHAGGVVVRYVNPQVNGSSTLTPTLNADASGNLTWTFTPTCGYPKGSLTLYAVDSVTGRTSNTVTQVVTGSASCP